MSKLDQWDTEMDSILKQYWGDLSKSARDIANMLGKTKNAVLGRARRLKLPNRVNLLKEKNKTEEVKNTPTVITLSKDTLIKHEPKTSITVVPISFEMIPIFTLKHNECKFPLREKSSDVKEYCRKPIYKKKLLQRLLQKKTYNISCRKII